MALLVNLTRRHLPSSILCCCWSAPSICPDVGPCRATTRKGCGLAFDVDAPVLKGMGVCSITGCKELGVGLISGMVRLKGSDASVNMFVVFHDLTILGNTVLKGTGSCLDPGFLNPEFGVTFDGYKSTLSVCLITLESQDF